MSVKRPIGDEIVTRPEGVMAEDPLKQFPSWEDLEPRGAFRAQVKPRGPRRLRIYRHMLDREYDAEDALVAMFIVRSSSRSVVVPADLIASTVRLASRLILARGIDVD